MCLRLRLLIHRIIRILIISATQNVQIKLMESKNKWSNLIGWFLKRPKIAGLLVSLILCIVVFYVVSQRYQIVKENKQKEMEHILAGVQQNIGQSLKNCYTTTLH